mmetsp:Transcript_34597/g.75727  ORF Transcript_34597/g.75727 Transcript_34597/m.75727 type:complete len:303 (+) Transcript_34597:146-1054(+)|eukprot:CAMPEP_0178502784 /NCGR_PEP_ID=MMETSP0696-20121128/17689_1 /TAXON_ID=265572 /ORGANISM="Extubocellulus spinifer, Strain CCMP396" /LENGTH=302 /DNA_ID=CAMNT_0020131865 /DNA_START=97 /DNA_END=1005 /DNA_ORIENTATION=+
MSEHCEEQEMEAEALEAIFMEAFQVIESTQPFKWSIKLVPVDCGGDEEEEEKENHVGIRLVATIPLDYPEISLPEFDVEIIKGLAGDQVKEIISLANEEAEANAGMPAIFAVCEAVRGWLAENNVKGLDDGSMHAQMMRKMKEAEKAKAKQVQEFEAQKETLEMSTAEKEEIEVRKRRAEGTPCNDENFYAWLKKFEEEMAQKAAAEEAASEREAGTGGKKKSVEKKDETKDRLTGFEQFSGKVGIMSLEAIEQAAEEAVNDESGDEEDLDVDEDLFNDSDSDLDLDFDDSDEDDSDDEPDI